jgi:predicted nucleic acid-binding protein
MLVYLDICCFNRPFDDQSQLLVRLQTEAKLNIQERIRGGKLALTWSAVMDMENDANPESERRKAIGQWRSLAAADIEVSNEVERLAEELAGRGIKPMDALHVACAISAGASWFFTTDKPLLRKMASEERIQVVDPVDFIRLSEETHDES